jgi:hypothetical protein
VTIRLRPHHLLCMLTYAGKGYSADFTTNFDHIAAQIASGNQIVEIAFGPDDVCAPLLADVTCHCHGASVFERDTLAAESLSQLLQRSIEPGTQIALTTATLDRMRQAFRAGTIRRACHGCQWVPLCDGIAASSFIDTRMLTFRSRG